MSDVENQIISSKFVKEIANLGGNIDRFVTKYTVKMLKDRHNEEIYLFIYNFFSLLTNNLIAESIYDFKT